MNVSNEFIIERNRIIRSLKADSKKAVDEITQKIIALEAQGANYKKLYESCITRKYVKREPKFKAEYAKYFQFKGDWALITPPAEIVCIKTFLQTLRNKMLYMTTEHLYFTQYNYKIYIHRVPWGNPHSRVFKEFAQRIGL